MKWKSKQFGEFEYAQDHVLIFPDGLIGFENLHKYILINEEESLPFLWLVSLEDQHISFPLIDPRTFKEEYPEGIHNKEQYSILVVASLKDRPEESVINLRSPILIENTTQRGRQVVLENEAYDFRQPLFSALAESSKG